MYHCKGKTEWPELLGVWGNVAAATIEAENPHVKARIVKKGWAVTHDFRCDRVWVWVDEDGHVFMVPRIG
ncbi:hypothetical protein QJS04_geneDACA009538 [Acorus gramineus]|uniref:Proteinase inhibitor n=1 Tax=Acorus gramineus TaxID=55184 RepID=A0AAV9AHN7_ACOGR|nr:hypothetical protein QJS04_geneDACA009538 [Acorus gramineus]